MNNIYKIILFLTLALALTSCNLFQKPASPQTNDVKVGILQAHPEDSEAAYLIMDDGTKLFVQTENEESNFVPFIGKEVELEGNMSYPLNPEARDQGVFHVKNITLKSLTP